MIFSKKKITIEYTVEQCTKCGTLTKRKFNEGDILFTKLSKCASCDGLMRIEKIFGETIEQ
jgi:NAD-dependent SIR2 family protein deacetylase